VAGNLSLGPETSNSYTVGAVFQPRFVPGLAITADYYNIKVTGAISSPTPADVIAACFGTTPQSPPAGAASNPACTSIRRDPLTGALSGDPATTPGLPSTLSNLGRLETDGIDCGCDLPS
jgi:outer membrane receptor protein involved in Fe transport